MLGRIISVASSFSSSARVNVKRGNTLRHIQPDLTPNLSLGQTPLASLFNMQVSLIDFCREPVLTPGVSNDLVGRERKAHLQRRFGSQNLRTGDWSNACNLMYVSDARNQHTYFKPTHELFLNLGASIKAFGSTGLQHYPIIILNKLYSESLTGPFTMSTEPKRDTSVKMYSE